MKRHFLTFLSVCMMLGAWAVDDIDMQRIYDEVKTPFKYGMVVAPQDNYHKIDCPTVFRQGDKWLMTYVVYNGKEGTDGRGYETWLAQSDDLLHWQTLGRILSYKDSGWDMNQRGGFPALIDWTWGGTYAINQYKNKYWMTYIGGHGTGYEAVREPLNIGLAWTSDNVSTAHEWQSDDEPLLSINDKDVQWWEKLVQYKSTIYDDPQKTLGKRFIMFYNAGGINPANNLKAERIGIALSNNLKKWKRYEGNPVYYHEAPGIITGDAQIVRMGDLYVMFYFSAYNPARKYNAFNTFSVSRDLIHWQDWQGPDLIYPTKPYDEMFAHKSYVVKHNGVVYHFYCAVNNAQQRGIAVATSVPMGRSAVSFPAPEATGRRTTTNLNRNWTARCPEAGDSVVHIDLPHNFDDYYGYRQLRHGNLHGKATYEKTFASEKKAGKRYFLMFEGVGTYATVTLNGHSYPKELVGRTSWTIDVTDALQSGDNHLKVLVDHPALQTESPWVCGGCSSEWGFSEGSQPLGIYRPVTLIETDEVRVEPFGVHIWNNTACDSVFIETEVKNYSQQAAAIELVNKFTLSSGKQVFRLSETLTLQPGETRMLRQAAKVADAKRWTLSDPYLYNLSTMIKRGGKTTDELRTPYGIRTASWPLSAGAKNDNRFYLNGQPTFINGTCEYEHMFGQSHAFSHEQIKARVKQIRNAGFNAFREGHQPHNLLYQQLFDQQGLLFWSQFSAHIWYDTPQFRQSFKRLLVRWIKERRNSPSIVLWGLQNESVLPKEFAQECCDLIRRLDPTCGTSRLITTCNGGEGSDWNVIQNWSGTYGGDPENYDNELRQPNQLLNGEYGAWRTIDLHGEAKYSEENFTKLLETKALKAEQAFNDQSQQGVCGHFQWLFSSHDNPGRVQPDGAYRLVDKIGPINYKGLTTIWEEPTKAYYMYKQHYGPDEGQPLTVTAADRNHDLIKGAAGWNYLYRINCGGDYYTDSYGQMWLQDNTTFSHSWAQDFEGLNPYQASQRHIAEPIRGTKDAELFQYFRFGRHRLWYDFSVDDGEYLVEIYTMEPWHGRSQRVGGDYEGLRIFSIAVNGEVVCPDVDPWAEAGYCGAMKRVVKAKAKNGRLRISFPEVKAGQAVVCAIAIATKEQNIVQAMPAMSPFSWKALDHQVMEKLPKEKLPKDTEARPATAYEPVKAGTGQWQIKPGLGQEYALRFKYKNESGVPVKARLTITDVKKAVLVDREVTFPPTPKKFKMLSTTTGTQINAGTYQVVVKGKGLEFSTLEIQ